MDMVSQDPIIGIDVSRDWLDIHVLPDDQHQRLPHTAEGHAYLVDIASKLGAIVCFEGYKDWKSIQWIDSQVAVDRNGGSGRRLIRLGLKRASCRLRKSKPLPPAVMPQACFQHDAHARRQIE